DSLLFRRMIEDNRAILRPSVRTLTVQSRRVMYRKEDFQGFASCRQRRIIRDLNHLGMSGAAGADLPVTGVRDAAAGVTRYHIGDAFQFIKDGFDAPEAAASQRNLL